MKAKAGVRKKAVLRKNSSARKPRRTRAIVPPPEFAEWLLRLYVAGQSPKSLAAFANLRKLCEAHLPNRFSIEVIDLSKHPHMAQNDQIVALPTLVRKLPPPMRRIIGDLSNTERVLVGMDLKPKPNGT